MLVVYLTNITYCRYKKYVDFTFSLIINVCFNNSIDVIEYEHPDVNTKIYLDYTISDIDKFMKFHGTHRVTIGSQEPPYFFRDNKKIYLINNNAISKLNIHK